MDELKIDKKRVLSAASKCSNAKEILKELFPEAFKNFDFRDIKTFEDACNALNINMDIFILGCKNSKLSLDTIAYEELKIITEAINQGWKPDWDNDNQRKWYPWFKLSSGFGFDDSNYDFGCTTAGVGSRLCFETEEKSNYAGQQFLDIYKQFLK